MSAPPTARPPHVPDAYPVGPLARLRRSSASTIAAVLSQRWPEMLGALVGVGWFLLLGGGRALAPSHLDWLADGDAAQHVLGWLFFRRSHWALPLGRIDGYAWPGGTTVGFTDANPLVAIPGKLLSPLLPLDFQYIGAWLLACFALQGWFGARLAALGSPALAYRILGGALAALAPPLAQRVGHDTLCAHFALLALVALHLAPPYDAGPARRALRVAAGLTLLLAAVHPYLALMAFLLTAALAARLATADGALAPGRAALSVVALFLALAAVFALLGYLTSAPSHGGGFGFFATDLLAFVNPHGASWLVPALPASTGAWEGNAYLGLGGLALVVAVALLAARRGWPPPARRRALAPLFAVAILLAAFSAADAWRAAGREVLSLRALYRPLAGVVGPFRSSGRFVWPLYYALIGGALVALPRLVRRPALAAALLGGAVTLQAIELAPRAYDARFHAARWRLEDPRWTIARGRYQHLALVPAQIAGGGPPCWGKEWREDAWRPLAYEAYLLGLTVNSGQLARGSQRRFERACREVEEDVAEGRLEARTVYVVHPSRLARLAGRPGVACGALDGYAVCVADEPGAPFAAALRGGSALPAADR